MSAAHPAGDRRLQLPLRLAKSALRRRRIDRVLDWLRFRLDTFPRSGPLRRLTHPSYQPLPWLGLRGGSRAAGTWSRWRAIERELDTMPGLRTGLDVGANYGFFTICLARRGVATVAIDDSANAGRTIVHAIRRLNLESVASLLTLRVAPESVELLPYADVVVFLAVWHHFARAYGSGPAMEIFRAIWARTRRVLFFETGEREMPPDFRLPAMEPDARTWLTGFLAEVCEGGEVRHLGTHPAFDAAGKPVERNLFAVVRRRGGIGPAPG